MKKNPLSIIKMLPILNHMLNFIFTGVDMVSDIMLAIDYCVVDAEWCALTWSFIAGPFLTLFIITLTYFYSDVFKSENGTKDPTHAWIYWKATELCMEAGPNWYCSFISSRYLNRILHPPQVRYQTYNA